MPRFLFVAVLHVTADSARNARDLVQSRVHHLVDLDKDDGVRYAAIVHEAQLPTGAD